MNTAYQQCDKAQNELLFKRKEAERLAHELAAAKEALAQERADKTAAGPVSVVDAMRAAEAQEYEEIKAVWLSWPNEVRARLIAEGNLPVDLNAMRPAPDIEALAAIAA